MTSYVAHSGPTARIEVRYQAPIPLTGARLVYLECRVDMVERGTKVWMSAEMRLGGPTGPIHATATGLWIREDIHSWFDLASGGVKCTYCIQKKIRKNCRASQNRRRCGRRARRGCTLFSARFQPCLVPPPPINPYFLAPAVHRPTPTPLTAWPSQMPTVWYTGYP